MEERSHLIKALQFSTALPLNLLVLCRTLNSLSDTVCMWFISQSFTVFVLELFYAVSGSVNCNHRHKKAWNVILYWTCGVKTNWSHSDGVLCSKQQSLLDIGQGRDKTTVWLLQSTSCTGEFHDFVIKCIQMQLFREASSIAFLFLSY